MRHVSIRVPLFLRINHLRYLIPTVSDHNTAREPSTFSSRDYQTDRWMCARQQFDN